MAGICGRRPARPDLEALTKELKLTDRVRFAGMIKPDEVPRWYRVGDIFVSASQSETQGLTYFEGMACGLPVLCRADPCWMAWWKTASTAGSGRTKPSLHRH